jgi:hypothetical protein
MDAVFPASNPLGIPDLDPERQPDCVPLPVWAWGSKSRIGPHSGTWHGYTDDCRFSKLLKEPAGLIETGCAAACEPNISIFDDTPIVLALASLYRKRYVARFWQLAGVSIFVDLNLPERILDLPEARYGIPADWRAFSTRGYDGRIESLDREYQLACSFGIRAPIFLVIGGGKKVAEWCQRTPGAVHSGYRSTREVYSRE